VVRTLHLQAGSSEDALQTAKTRIGASRAKRVWLSGKGRPEFRS
jgi:hypothetical protein